MGERGDSRWHAIEWVLVFFWEKIDSLMYRNQNKFPWSYKMHLFGFHLKNPFPEILIKYLLTQKYVFCFPEISVNVFEQWDCRIQEVIQGHVGPLVLCYLRSCWSKGNLLFNEPEFGANFTLKFCCVTLYEKDGHKIHVYCLHTVNFSWLSSADIFVKFLFFFKFFQGHYQSVKQLDPDQDWCSVGPDLGPNFFKCYQETTKVATNSCLVKNLLLVRFCFSILLSVSWSICLILQIWSC